MGRVLDRLNSLEEKMEGFVAGSAFATKGALMSLPLVEDRSQLMKRVAMLEELMVLIMDQVRIPLTTIIRIP